MHRIKALALVSLLIICFTTAVIILSHQASPRISADNIARLQTRYQTSMTEKLVNAETSLLKQGELITTDEKLIQELADVRGKLLTTTADDLKARTNNKWNEGIFNALLAWRNKQSAFVNTELSQRNEAGRLQEATAQDMFPPILWWKRAPDLALAFAVTPLADGSLASTLTAYGVEGKILRAGRSYDRDYKILQNVQESKQPALGLFTWDNKMYIAVSQPILQDSELIGQVVLGMELSRETLELFSPVLAPHMNLRMYYTRKADKNSVFVPADQDRIIQSLKNDKFISAATYDSGNAERIDLSNVVNNKIYINENDDNILAFSRFNWMWDDTWEAGFYLVSDLNHASETWDGFRQKVILVGFLMLLFGLMGAFAFTSAYQKRLNELKLALLEAISSGNPLDAEAFSCLPGIEGANLGRYIIKPIDEGKANDASIDLKMLLMDIDEDNDEGVTEAEKAAAAEAAKNAPIDPEMKALYDNYMAKRHETGNDTPMEYDQFLRRMNRNIEKLKQAHPNTEITFNVTVLNGKAVLTPAIKK